MSPDLYQRISIALKQELPGQKAHLKLYPKNRVTGKPNEHTKNAAVLILLFPNHNQEISILFIRRPEYPGHHSAQVSFPGGQFEPADKDLKNTAIRESKEEVGVDPNTLIILGQLSSLYIPVSNYLVFPFIGYCNQKPDFKIDPKEVSYIFSIKVQELFSLKVKNTQMKILDENITVPYFEIENEMVWGATSMILAEFIDVLKQGSV